MGRTWGRAGSSRDMWFHHPSYALPLTATVPRLPNGMERLCHSEMELASDHERGVSADRAPQLAQGPWE